MADTDNSIVCGVCGCRVAPGEAVSGHAVRAPVALIIKKTNPDWSAEDFICLKDLNRFRVEFVRDALELEKGDLSSLEADMAQSRRDHEFLAKNINVEFEKQLTLGERIADAVAAFGGSWKFILSYLVMMIVWITINSLLLMHREPFDPYPYILLNLVLSCLSSLQGPVILMSQNRQDSKDRLRSEYDYRVNLKSELEIRHLNAKMDLLVTRQWQRLMEIQEIQTELMQQHPGRQ